jgi:hypothetical protein
MTTLTMKEMLEGVEYTLRQAQDNMNLSYHSSAQSYAEQAITELLYIAALIRPLWKITEDEFKEGKRLWDQAEQVKIAARGRLGG